MSSPVVNKDTLYHYKTTNGPNTVCFISSDGTIKQGYSFNLVNGSQWEWTHSGKLGLTPIGQRCILQW